MNVMWRMTMRGLWEHRRRMFGTLIAVFIGVSFLAGTLSLSDTLGSAIDGTLATAYSTTDVVVQSSGVQLGGTHQPRGQIDGSVLAPVRQVSGVAVAEPVLEGSGVLVGSSGKPVAVTGTREASTWIPDRTLNPWHLVSGAAPQGTNQVVIDQASANAAGLHVGQSAVVDMPQPVRVTVSGIADFGAQTSSGVGSYVAFTLAGAQKYIADGADVLTSVVVRATPGVSQQELADRIGAVLPRQDAAITGQALIAQTESEVDSNFFDFFQVFLGVFTGVALLVAALSIHNTFSISAAQRSRDAALLRAVGATRRQVTAGLLIEACTLGVIGSALGLGGGVAITAGLESAFSGFGVSLPTGGLVLTGATIVIALTVGAVVTVAAATAPAVRAGRVAPVEALREAATDTSAESRSRTLLGLVSCLVGAVVSGAGGVAGNLLLTGLGGVAAVLGIVALGPRIAALTARAIAGPARRRGTAGTLAQRNVARDPKRTAGAATALTVGIVVVSLFTVFAASLKAGITSTIDGAFTGQVVVTGKSGIGSTGFSPQAVESAQAVPGVAHAVGVGSGNVLIDGVSTGVRVTDPAALPSVFAMGVTSGSLANAQLAISSTAAADQNWHVGQTVTATFANARSVPVTIGAIYSATEPLGDYILASTVWDAQTTQVVDHNVYIALSPGADQDTVVNALSSAEAKYAGTSVQTKHQFADSQATTVNTLLDIVYLMLALAIIIALLGIANTLSLSVHERTREIGLLRAVGATGKQVRSMIRWEALITTLIGTLTGLVLGCLLGWALVEAGAASGNLAHFTLPTLRLVVILLICGAAGLLAGVRPAGRAARLDVLEAVASQ